MKLLNGICAAGLAATFAVTGLAPANAAPTFVPQTTTTQSDVVQIQDGARWKKSGNWNGNKNWNGNNNRNGNWNGGNNKSGWYNGHRGYRYKRPGYRYNNGLWFPAGAFVAGAIIGGAIANGNNYNNGGGSTHVQWCYDRYRSYRASDNTFQPNNGPRQQCRGPY